MRNKYSDLPENPKGDLDVHGKIILKWTSKKWGVGGQDSAGSGQRRRDEIISAVWLTFMFYKRQNRISKYPALPENNSVT